jgi:alkylation response protein AidB-like acyl-CoA dehydrogenase
VDFSFSEEQQLLRDSIEKYVRQHCDVDRHIRLRATETGFDPECWQAFADLGWLCIPFSEADGGLGGSAADLLVACEALGGSLVREPFLVTAVTCGTLLRLGGSAAQRENYLPALMAGRSQWALAQAETQTGYRLEAEGTVAEPADGGWRLTGHKIAVLNGHVADHFIVSARDSQGGTGLFIVDADASGLQREAFHAVDDSRGATLRLDGVRVEGDKVLAPPGSGLALLQDAVDRVIVAMGGEGLGAMQCLLEATVEYCKTREQFGQPIGKFQALQHRMADMYLKVEELRSLLYNAAIQLDEESPDAPAACAAVKVKLAEAGRFVSQQAVQLHGGIGMTDELIVGHHYKRLLLLSKLFGDEDYHLERYRELRAA